MTTVLTDGNYIVADKLMTCTRSMINRRIEGSSQSTQYQFGVLDTVKISKIEGLSVQGQVVKAVAAAGSMFEASDFLRDIRDYIEAFREKSDPNIELQAFIKTRRVFKVPYSGEFIILFLTEGKQAVTISVTPSNRKVKNADGSLYPAEAIRFTRTDLSEGKGTLVGLGSGFSYFDDLGHFLTGDQPHILDAYCYCVNRDYQHSSKNFSVYSLELDHLDEAVEFPSEEFEGRLKRFTEKLDFTKQILGSLPIASRVYSPERK